MGYLHALSQDFISKKKSNYSLGGCKSLSYFSAAEDRKGMKRA